MKLIDFEQILIQLFSVNFLKHLKSNRIPYLDIEEHNSFKNVSNGPAFCDKRKFKRFGMASMIQYNVDKKRKKLLILYSFTPSDMNF